MRQKFGNDSGYLTARETLECMPVLTMRQQPNSYDYESFAGQFALENAQTAPFLSAKKRKHVPDLTSQRETEDNYQTAREHLSSDEEHGGFDNLADSDTKQQSNLDGNSNLNAELSTA